MSLLLYKALALPCRPQDRKMWSLCASREGSDTGKGGGSNVPGEGSDMLMTHWDAWEERHIVMPRM